MFEQMKWVEIYKLWERNAHYFPQSLMAPLEVERVFVEYKQDEIFYGHDWLENIEADQRKKTIQTNVFDFLYRTKPTSKGTIQTVRMLSEALNNEERAAIWIAATTFELMNMHYRNDVSSIARQIHYTTCSFLQDRFYIWHHAMKKTVPDIMIPHRIIESISEADRDTVMQLVQMNTLMIKGNYKVLLYSSLEGDTELKDYSLRKSSDDE